MNRLGEFPDNSLKSDCYGNGTEMGRRYRQKGNAAGSVPLLLTGRAQTLPEDLILKNPISGIPWKFHIAFQVAVMDVPQLFFAGS